MTQARYREEANVFDQRTPRGKAMAMAAYCTDASRIHAYVTSYYGRPCGVTLADCAHMIADQRRHTGRKIPDWPEESKPKLALVQPAEPREPMFKRPQEPKPTPEPQPVPDAGFDVRVLIDRVARAFGITHGELVGNCRRPVFVDARAVIVAVLRERGWSFPRIGRVLNQTDHSSAIHSLRMFPAYAKRNPIVVKCYNRYRPDQQKPRAL